MFDLHSREIFLSTDVKIFEHLFPYHMISNEGKSSQNDISSHNFENSIPYLDNYHTQDHEQGHGPTNTENTAQTAGTKFIDQLGVLVYDLTTNTTSIKVDIGQSLRKVGLSSNMIYHHQNTWYLEFRLHPMSMYKNLSYPPPQ